jgi:N-hydroxyarylamine O-acetyltransferase
VGNGKSFRDPLRIASDHELAAEESRYKFSNTEIGPAVLEKSADSEWRTRFIFSKDPLKRSDFLDACHWTQTSPDSIFTKNKICTLARENGRVTLKNTILSLSDERGTTEMDVSPEAYRHYLKTHFGIII